MNELKKLVIMTSSGNFTFIFHDVVKMQQMKTNKKTYYKDSFIERKHKGFKHNRPAR